MLHKLVSKRSGAAAENEMVSFTARHKRGAQDPPARVAALVWALTELVVGNQPQRAKGVWLSGRPL
jgi:phage terminase large subunit-like protein